MKLHEKPRRRRRVAVVASTALVVTGLATNIPVSAATESRAETPVVEVELVRTLELEDVGVVDPFSIGSSADGERLFVAQASDPDSVPSHPTAGQASCFSSWQHSR